MGKRVAAALLATALGLVLVATGGSARADCVRGASARFYDEARRAFEDKRYDDSIALLRQASACEPNPIYLWNIARAYEESNRPKDALAAWRAYVEVVSDGRERRMTEGRISALSKAVDDIERLEREKAIAEEATRRAEAAARAPAPTVVSSPHVSTTAWIVTATGAASLAGGVVLAVLASSEHASAVREPEVVSAEALQSRARGLAEAADGAFIVGGIVAAGGLAWIGVDLTRRPSAGKGVGLVVAGPGVMLVGRF